MIDKLFQNDTNIIWWGNSGIMRMDNGRIAEIYLEKSGLGYSDKIIVNIKHLIHGFISAHAFYFNEYMDINKRIDNKRNSVYQGGYRLEKIEGKMEWVVAIPPQSEIDLLLSAIYGYIDTFRLEYPKGNLGLLYRDELIDLLYAYDNYIQDIVDDLPLQYIDRVPVTIQEFYENDYMEEEE